MSSVETRHRQSGEVRKVLPLEQLAGWFWSAPMICGQQQKYIEYVQPCCLDHNVMIHD